MQWRKGRERIWKEGRFYLFLLDHTLITFSMMWHLYTIFFSIYLLKRENAQLEVHVKYTLSLGELGQSQMNCLYTKLGLISI